jgi:hypothetical protein
MACPYAPPPIESATDPVFSTADLGERWRALMGPLGFGERLLWIGFIGPDRRLIKALTQVELGPRPRRRYVESTMAALRHVIAEFNDDTTIALLLTRPGRGPISPADRQWASMLADLAAEFGLPIARIFRANDDALVVIDPADESAAN